MFRTKATFSIKEQAPYLKQLWEKKDMVFLRTVYLWNVSLPAFNEATGHSARPLLHVLRPM